MDWEDLGGLASVTGRSDLDAKGAGLGDLAARSKDFGLDTYLEADTRHEEKEGQVRKMRCILNRGYGVILGMVVLAITYYVRERFTRPGLTI